ncbi:hypothetical protein AVEN_76860-1 [Araneus ventricosus]|uniref:Uncharacterized protein n=1 Tax=Araneus ventricosus TaxID=182803 RepID=A0A4Y2KZ97_ARAVE|nr:hypothetical protein AVEN_76860-1 [Araneus ventricosus]
MFEETVRVKGKGSIHCSDESQSDQRLGTHTSSLKSMSSVGGGHMSQSAFLHRVSKHCIAMEENIPACLLIEHNKFYCFAENSQRQAISPINT